MLHCYPRSYEESDRTTIVKSHHIHYFDTNKNKIVGGVVVVTVPVSYLKEHEYRAQLLYPLRIEV